MNTKKYNGVNSRLGLQGVAVDASDVMRVSGATLNPRLPHADITNSPFLFGDPFGDIDEGDFEDGDFEEGDVEEGDYEDGDIEDGDYATGDPLEAYLATAGDPAPRKKAKTLRSRWSSLPRGKKVAVAAGTGLTSAALAALIAHSVQKKKKARAALNSAGKKNFLARQRNVIRNTPKANKKGSLFFTYLSGGNLTQAPLVPGASFVTDTVKYMLDKASVETPFYQFIAPAAYTTVWTATVQPASGSYLYPAFMVNIGSAALQASPGTIVTVDIAACTLIDGSTLTTTGGLNWIFTYRAGFDSRVVIFLWKMVANKPMPILGSLTNARPLTIVVGGINSLSAVTVTIPGSQHPWTLAMRNSVL